MEVVRDDINLVSKLVRMI